MRYLSMLTTFLGLNRVIPGIVHAKREGTLGMESDLHTTLKETAFAELEREGYTLFFEPSEPPEDRLSWRFYRPDILGVISNKDESSLVLVECETNPKIRRVRKKFSKIRNSLTFQKRLNERHILHLLLVIPFGFLHKVNTSEIRRLWEVWIVNYKGKIIHKIPKNKYTEAARSYS